MRGKVNIFPQGVEVHFSQTLHFLGKQSIPRERESYLQGKFIPQRENFPSEGKFAQFSLGGKILAVTSLGGPKKGKNKKKNPSFIVRNCPKRHSHKIVAVFLVFSASSLSLFLCPFPLVSPYFLLFHPILEPGNSPPNEVTGKILPQKMFRENTTELSAVVFLVRKDPLGFFGLGGQ